MIRKFLLVVCFVFFSAPVSYAKIIDIHDFVLDNGLTVLVVSNHKAPVGLVKLYYKAGSVNDPLKKGGIAHLLEHMMFRGTKKVRGQDFNIITEKNGADNNAYTTYLHTGYYEFSDISKLELMLALEADRMENLKLDEKVFLKERDIVLEERMQRFETNPITKFYEELNKKFWLEHPFARPVSGEIEEIKNLNLSDAKEFYEKYYNPKNAILVIVGDITKNEAKVLVEKYFGGIAKKTLPYKKEVITDIKPEVVDWEVELEGVNQPRFVAYWHLEADKFSKKEILALAFLIEFLSGDDTAYLDNKLVYEEKKFLSISLGVDYDETYGGKIAFYVVPLDEKMKLVEIKKIISDEVSKGAGMIREDDVIRIRNEILSNAIYMLENPSSIAGFVGGMKLDGYEVLEIENYDEMIKSISKEDVVKVYNKIKNIDKKEINGLVKVK